MLAPRRPNHMDSPERVAIVTHDGYEAWGLALDPVGAATDYALVDAFTRFLEKRVVTQNMELLRRMMAEYFCHCETTVRAYIAQCSSMICIGPFDADDKDLPEAQRLLHQPRSFARSGLSASVFTFLVTRLRTARSWLLMQFFVEFCQGNDTALCEFVENSEGFVSVLPVAAPQLDHALVASSDGIPFTSVEPPSMPAPSLKFDAVTPRRRVPSPHKQTIQPTGKKRRHRERDEHEEDVSREDHHKLLRNDTNDGDAVNLPDPTKFVSRFTKPSEGILRVKTHFARKIAKLEKHEPWTKVFTSALPLPFDETAFPDLAQTFRSFWARYGRVVWERQFWVPLASSDRFALDNQQRRARQRHAALTFEKLIHACFEQFGARFFYRLDHKRHPGWWYRSFCVDLLGLSAVVGYDECNAYVESQFYERFPDCGQPLPLPSANFGMLQRKQERTVSESLWLDETRPEVAEMKTSYTTYVAKKNQKKTQHELGKAAKREKNLAIKSMQEKTGSRNMEKKMKRLPRASLADEDDLDEKPRFISNVGRMGTAYEDAMNTVKFLMEEEDATSQI